jgi:hypothetical protein
MRDDAPNENLNSKEPNGNNPFDQFLERYKDFQVTIAKDLPNNHKAIVAFAGTGGLAHAGLAVVKAAWIPYVSLDLLLLSFALLVFRREKRHVNTTAKHQRENPP